MKRTRKLITFILTVVMVLSMSMNVWAAEITIDDGDVTGAEYSAYRLLDATDLGDGKFSYTVNETYRGILKNAIGDQNLSDEEIIAHIKSLDTADTIQAFANDVYAEIKKASLTSNDFKVTSTNVFDNVDQGYYLIAETSLGSDDAGYSLVMLDTAGNSEITVTTKEEYPTLSKQITDDNNSIDDEKDIYNGEKNNLSIGSKVQFELTTTIPDNANQYDYYYCIFSDLLTAGLTFDEASLVVKSNGNTLVKDTDYKLYTANTDPNADGNTCLIDFPP